MSDPWNQAGARMPSTGFAPEDDLLPDSIRPDSPYRKPLEPWEVVAAKMAGKTPGEVAGIPRAGPKLDPQMMALIAAALRR